MGLTFNLGRVSPSVFTDSSLNVGIGAAPSGTYKFEVTGLSGFSSYLTVSSASYLTSRLKLNNTATGGNLWSISSGNQNNSTNNSLFTIINETLSKNTFVLSPTGKLALGADLGTTNPADDLAVFGTNTILKVVDLTGNNSNINLQATNTEAYLRAGYTTTAIPLIFQTGNTTRLTITSAGNVGIGTSSPARKLTVVGTIAAILSDANDVQCALSATATDINIAATYGSTGSYLPLTFSTNSTERMRITAQGYFKFSNDGTYYNPTGTYNEIRQAAGSGEIIYGTATSGTYTGTLIALDASRAANTAFNFYSGNANGVAQFKVSGTGVIYAQNTSVQPVSSDVNLKTDIKDYDKGLAEVLAMKPRYFKYKDNIDEEKAGFIAQEMNEAVNGSMVDGIKNSETNEVYKTYQIDWYPLLVKAIQELSAQNQDLKSRLDKAGL